MGLSTESAAFRMSSIDVNYDDTPPPTQIEDINALYQNVHAVHTALERLLKIQESEGEVLRGIANNSIINNEFPFGRDLPEEFLETQLGRRDGVNGDGESSSPFGEHVRSSPSTIPNQKMHQRGSTADNIINFARGGLGVKEYDSNKVRDSPSTALKSSLTAINKRIEAGQEFKFAGMRK